MSKFKCRSGGLLVFTGLVVAFVHHAFDKHWDPWDDTVDFLGSWFVHTFFVLLFAAATMAAIVYSHKFFLGYAFDAEGFKANEKFKQAYFYILMTALVAAVGTLVVGHPVSR